METFYILRGGALSSPDAEALAEGLQAKGAKAVLVDRVADVPPANASNNATCIVVDPFSGPEFDAAISSGFRILGEPIVSQYVDSDDEKPLEVMHHIQFNNAMSSICIFFSDLGPEVTPPLRNMAAWMGATIISHYSAMATHIVAARVNGVVLAARREKQKVVKANWVEETWARCCERTIETALIVSKHHKLPPLAGCQLCISSEALQPRMHKRLTEVATGLGADCHDKLTAGCSHYITNVVGSDTYALARQHGAVPVTTRWLLDCRSHSAWCDEAGYLALTQEDDGLSITTPTRLMEQINLNDSVASDTHSPKRRRLHEQSADSRASPELPRGVQAAGATLTVDSPSAAAAAAARLSPEVRAVPLSKRRSVKTGNSPIVTPKRKRSEALDKTDGKKASPIPAPRRSRNRRKNRLSSRPATLPLEAQVDNAIIAAKRKHQIEELASVEENFCENLKIIIYAVKVPLTRDGLMDVATRDIIFSNVDKLYDLSVEISEMLQDRVANWNDETTLIGDIFLERLNRLLPLYRQYVTNQDRAKSELESVLAKSKPIRDYLETLRHNPRCKKQSLGDLLMHPVQQIGRYPLLLKELRKTTPISHPDYQNIDKALHSLQNIMTQVDMAKSLQERHEQLFKIARHIEGFPTLVNSSRYFIARIDVKMTSIDGSTKKAGLFLFNDGLLLTMRNTTLGRKLQDTLRGFQGKEKRAYRHVVFTKLEDIDACDVFSQQTEEQRIFVVSFPSVPGFMPEPEIYFQAPSEEEKLAFLAKVRETVYEAVGELTEDMLRDAQAMAAMGHEPDSALLLGSSFSTHSLSMSMLSDSSMLQVSVDGSGAAAAAAAATAPADSTAPSNGGTPAAAAGGVVRRSASGSFRSGRGSAVSSSSSTPVPADAGDTAPADEYLEVDGSSALGVAGRMRLSHLEHPRSSTQTPVADDGASEDEGEYMEVPGMASMCAQMLEDSFVEEGSKENVGPEAEANAGAAAGAAADDPPLLRRRGGSFSERVMGRPLRKVKSYLNLMGSKRAGSLRRQGSHKAAAATDGESARPSRGGSVRRSISLQDRRDVMSFRLNTTPVILEEAVPPRGGRASATTFKAAALGQSAKSSRTSHA